jgi:mycobactin lysine-N-oxygenase
MAKRIAVVGGGPKAAAICAKAAALRDLGLSAPDVVVFEKSAIGGAWRGDGGYTDGDSRLCTPIVRDLGFPYASSGMGARAAQVMLARFSWPAFLIDKGGESYARWINRGSPRPLHRDFADYLRWAVEASNATVHIGHVSGLAHASGRWTVRTLAGETFTDFDGVVITGSGPPLNPLPGRTGRVLDGVNFWARTDDVRAWIRQDPEAGAVIIGAGGTAASVASWLIRRMNRRFPIRIVGREATLFTRSAGYFEDRFFGGDDAWAVLDNEARRKVVDRLTRGVVWQDVIELLGDADDLVYSPGNAREFVVRDNETMLRLERSDGAYDDLPGAVFVDCRGFLAWWFPDLFDTSDPALRVLMGQRGALEEGIGEDLALRDPFPYPNLHVPMSASLIGPAATNLMALGWMADRILGPYLDKAELSGLLGIGSGNL